MKTLSITQPEQYELLYEAVVGRPRGYNIQQARVVGKILDKFECVGRVKEVMKGVSLFTPNDLPVTIQLEDAEHAIIVEVFMEMTWSGTGARKAVEVEDWLNG